MKAGKKKESELYVTRAEFEQKLAEIEKKFSPSVSDVLEAMPKLIEFMMQSRTNLVNRRRE